VEPGTLIAPEKTLLTTDMKAVLADQHWFEGVHTFKIARSGTINGFAAWFNAHLSPSIDLDTGPELPETHWSQTALFWPPTSVSKGDEISVAIRVGPHPDEPRYVRLELEWDGTSHCYQLE
jgi:hypothetical protein